MALYVTGMGKVNTAVEPVSLILADEPLRLLQTPTSSAPAARVPPYEYGVMGDVFVITAASRLSIWAIMPMRANCPDQDRVTTWYPRRRLRQLLLQDL